MWKFGTTIKSEMKLHFKKEFLKLGHQMFNGLGVKSLKDNFKKQETVGFMSEQ